MPYRKAIREHGLAHGRYLAPATAEWFQGFKFSSFFSMTIIKHSAHFGQASQLDGPAQILELWIPNLQKMCFLDATSRIQLTLTQNMLQDDTFRI